MSPGGFPLSPASAKAVHPHVRGERDSLRSDCLGENFRLDAPKLFARVPYARQNRSGVTDFLGHAFTFIASSASAITSALTASMIFLAAFSAALRAESKSSNE